MTEENPNFTVADKNAVLAITNAWKILHVLGVSLAEVGRYWALTGDEAGRRALQQVLRPEMVQGIFAAEEELRTAISILSPDMVEQLETMSEALKYWDGPDSPNEAPELELVTRSTPPEGDES